MRLNIGPVTTKLVSINRFYLFPVDLYFPGRWCDGTTSRGGTPNGKTQIFTFKLLTAGQASTTNKARASISSLQLVRVLVVKTLNSSHLHNFVYQHMVLKYTKRTKRIQNNELTLITPISISLKCHSDCPSRISK